MTKYWLNESFLYEVYADSEEQARELFQEYMEATGTDEQDEFDIEFIDNEINVERTE